MTKLITFGVFDLLHVGHLHLFEQAARYGDLTVATADDASIYQFKSSDRPIIPLEDRVRMLKALWCVKRVETFGFTAKNMLSAHEEVLKKVKPDIFVQGQQANHEHFLSVVNRLKIPIMTVHSLDTSTTKIIEKIRRFADYEQLAGHSNACYTLTEAEMRP